jgi:hypothetical protein
MKARTFGDKQVVEVNSLGVDDPLYEIARHKNGVLYLYHYRGSFSRTSMNLFFDYGEKVILPPEENEFTTNTRFASKLEEYESVAGLLRGLEDFVSLCIDVSESDRFLLACFALSTWVADSLPVAPYLALTGLPGSGKSTALSVLHSVCYRGLMTSDINTARDLPSLRLPQTDDSHRRTWRWRWDKSSLTPAASRNQPKRGQLSRVRLVCRVWP